LKQKIAIIAPGGLPIPPNEGGAVEHLIYGVVLENEIAANPLDLTIYSIASKPGRQYSASHRHTRWEFVEATLLDRIVNRLVMWRILSRISCKYKQYPFFHRTLKKLRTVKYDLIVTQNRPDLTHYLSRVSTTPVALHLHNEYLSFPLREMRKGMIACHRAFTVSRFIAEQLGAAFPEHRPKIVPIINGIDAALFNPLRWPAAREMMRAKYQIRPDDFVLVYAGRLNAGKGVDRLVKAFNLLDDLPDVKLMVVGASWYNDDSPTEFVDSLKKASLPFKDRIVFTGYVAYETMPQIYCAADIAVFPFIFEEPCALVVIESLSMGLPVISTRCGGVPEVITSECGILLDRDNLEVDIAAAVRRLYHHPEVRLAMGEAGRSVVLDSFTQRHYYERFAKAVADLAEG